MAKAIIEFNLDDLDDEQAHLRFVKSGEMALVLWELGSNFKKTCEQAIDQIDKCSADEALDIFMNKYYELLEEHDINPDKLTY